MPGSARGRRCRMWLDYEKRMICAQTRKPRLSVSQAGRRYDVNAKQAFNWLKDPKSAPIPENTEPGLCLPVEVSSLSIS